MNERTDLLSSPVEQARLNLREGGEGKEGMEGRQKGGRVYVGYGTYKMQDTVIQSIRCNKKYEVESKV